MKKTILTLLVSLFMLQSYAQMQPLRPLPATVDYITSLDGTWRVDVNPTSDYHKRDYQAAEWFDVKVPGELAMQGIAIEHDKAVVYQRRFTLPASYSGRETIIRFDGVYSSAKLYINGEFVREHHGGFTRWECDITRLVRTGGAENVITLEVIDPLDEISYASGYAHHPIGGILRDVTIYSLPRTHIEALAIETIFKGDDFTKADLALNMAVKGPSASQLRVSLTDPNGRKVELGSAALIDIAKGGGAVIPRFEISNPQLWDAEHPRLYKLRIELLDRARVVSTINREVGFRQVRIEGDRMLVNGSPVKLRGACRHDMHPTLGRTTSRELDSLDAVLFKRSNMNFVRTSHYPPTERFLEFCDRVGLYVECETALCFVDTHRQKNYAPAATQNDAAYTDRYLSQLQEMVTSLRNHSSIIFWSVGNECQWGSNFHKSYDWAKTADTLRPSVFSYPGTVPADVRGYDILSMHYPGVNGTMNQYGAKTNNYNGGQWPALFDEWAHVPCYTYETLRVDPGIRDFWGESLDRMWSGLFANRGGLGGAIWGFIDETFMLPTPRVGKAWWRDFSRTAKPLDYSDRSVGYGEWGIIDVWRREKPEFWGTKKAYSPVRIDTRRIDEWTVAEPLRVELHNRFDHTNINEIDIYYIYKGVRTKIKSPDIAPHAKGLISIPAMGYASADQIDVEFCDKSGAQIDIFRITMGNEPLTVKPLTASKTITIKREADVTSIVGDGFQVPFNNVTGLIENARVGANVVIASGPTLNFDVNFNHLTGAEVRSKAANMVVRDTMWRMKDLSFTEKGDRVEVLLKGGYGDLKIDYTITVHASGLMEFGYITQGEPNGWLREAGLRFTMPEGVNTVEWQREGYWSYYPEGHFAATTGRAPLYNDYVPAYGAKPLQGWELDTHNYYYFGDPGADSKRPLTQIAKSMKENVYSYSLLQSGAKGGVTIFSSTASLGCRLSSGKDGKLMLMVNNRWDYPEIAWGDYCKEISASPCYGVIKMQLVK